jgi:hypothetical protein
MKLLCLVFILLIASCQDYNSNSADESRYEEISFPPGASAELQASYRIIKDRCFVCHSEWSSYKTDQQWVDAGLVDFGQASNSSLIYRLKNFSPPGDMPTGAYPTMPNSEYQKLLDWVGP